MSRGRALRSEPHADVLMALGNRRPKKEGTRVRTAEAYLRAFGGCLEMVLPNTGQRTA